MLQITDFRKHLWIQTLHSGIQEIARIGIPAYGRARCGISWGCSGTNKSF
jgi:hypothetical protein